MYGILLSAFNTILGWVFKQTIIKFGIMFAMWFVIQDLIAYLISFIPSPDSLTGGLSSLDSGTWYLLDLFCFSSGAPLVVTAFVYRFLIKRLPLIG